MAIDSTGTRMDEVLHSALVYAGLLKYCSSKYPYLFHRETMEIPRRRGLVKANVLKKSMDQLIKLEFPEGCGSADQKPSIRGIFSGTTQCAIQNWEKKITIN